MTSDADPYRDFALSVLALHRRTHQPWNAVPMCSCGIPRLNCAYACLAERNGVADDPALADSVRRTG